MTIAAYELRADLDQLQPCRRKRPLLHRLAAGIRIQQASSPGKCRVKDGSCDPVLSIWSSPMKFATTLAVVALVTLFLSVGAARADGDAAEGERVFKRCKICHTIEEGGGGPTKQGPNLHGVYGREAGAAEPGSVHSGALEKSGVIWDEQTLTEWLAAPTDFIEGSKMTFRLTKEQDIADVIEYLEANSPDAE